MARICIADEVSGAGAREQLRDLYERIPFVRGRARVEMLHRLQCVQIELQKAREARPGAPAARSDVAGH
jgi:hypothetical protein